MPVKPVRLFVLLLLALMMSACASLPDPEYRPVPPQPQVQAEPVAASGSIYQAANGVRWFEDLKARRVGDTLTIVLVESTNASKENSTSTSKETDIGLSNPTLLGSPVQFDVRRNFALENTTNNNMEIGISGGQTFDGSGSTSQSARLNGSVTVSVAEVLPNGNLVVRGEKMIVLDQGEEYVRIRGIVRPIDISADNSVASTKVAHAEITYGGRGAVADAGSQGWLSRFFMKFWPF
ncbi:MAG: flagellar basal body L-ring protein FlgH [Gammaproteobacteria bacterium]|nr:flagellar basal body L-ring protein FlgH [Gammaproteobacteria bacterium]